jgi:hypothetical protein
LLFKQESAPALQIGKSLEKAACAPEERFVGVSIAGASPVGDIFLEKLLVKEPGGANEGERLDLKH